MRSARAYIMTLIAMFAWLIPASKSHAGAPALITYQGRVLVDGTNFTGTGRFKFALVDASGTITYWSNDGSSVAGGPPGQAVTLGLDKGYYAVMLGDTTLSNMTAITPAAIRADDVRLRVWFSHGTNDFEQLVPDQRLASVPYAMMASSVADGAITGSSISPDPAVRTALREVIGAAAADLSNAAAQQAIGAIANPHTANSSVSSIAGVPVATRLMFPNQGLYSAPSPTITYRSSHVVLRAGNILRLLWLNQSYNGTASNNFTLTASIQVAETQATSLSSVQIYRIRFSGQDSVTVPAGGYVLSDPIFIRYETGNVLFVRSCCASAAPGNNWPMGMFINRENEGTAPGDQTMTDAKFSTDATGYAPQLICGPSTDGKWVYATGDSILDGSADPVNNRGFFDLWQLATNTPGTRSSHPGETAAMAYSQFMGARMLMALGATHALHTNGTNDIGQGASLATCQANLIGAWRDFSLAGMRTYQGTILPRATSADNWTTAANQTPWGPDSVRIATNEWLRAGAPCTPSGATYVAAAIGSPGAVPCPYLAGVVDLAAAVEVNAGNVLTRNGGRWRVGASLRSAKATGGSASSIIDTAVNFNAFSRSVAGCLVRITAGAGAGQVNWVVGAATDNQINLLNNFGTPVNATSVYEIIDTPTRDGIHPSLNRHSDIAAYMAANFHL